jgi:hypothetical protein
MTAVVGLQSGRELIDQCKELRERRSSFSEPDVIIEIGQFGLIFIEAKYRSGNDIKPAGLPRLGSLLGCELGRLAKGRCQRERPL